MITGGTRGIGLATVKALLAGGAHEVAFTWRSDGEAAQRLCAGMRDQGLPVTCFRMDLNDTKSIEDGLAAEIARGGNFDVVVHNAGFAKDAAFYFMDASDWRAVLDASLNSMFYVNKLVLPGMVQKRWGRIVALASISGEAGNRGQANYAAAKGAVIAAAKSLAKEMAVKGITVNVVSPGLIETDMTAELASPSHPMHGELRKMIPAGRFGKPEEVASVVRFLASDEAAYVNGAVVRVNGGLYT